MNARRAILLLVCFVLTIPLLIQARPVGADLSRPNIIIVITDDQFAESVGIMRKVMANPYGKWVQFPQGFTVDSIGGVSRVSLLTGQYTHHHLINDNFNTRYLNDNKLLPVWLKNEGYYTAFIGKYLNGYPNVWGGRKYIPPGWDSFLYYGHKKVDVYNKQAVTVLTKAIDTQDKPFFLWLAHRAPQRKAIPPIRYQDADVSAVPLPTTKPNFNEADVSDKPARVKFTPLLIPGGYSYKIKGYPGYMWDPLWVVDEFTRSLRQTLAIDDGMQMIVDLLAEKGELDNTVIFFISDSGYSWGSHRKVGRGCPYEECNQIPFLVFYPGLKNPGGATPYAINRLVSNVDITATIVELAELQPNLQPQDGNSLLPLLDAVAPNNPAQTPWPDVLLIENLCGTTFAGVRTTEWKYLENGDGFRELYDLVNDPFELKNQAKNPAYASVIPPLAAKLDELLADD